MRWHIVPAAAPQSTLAPATISQPDAGLQLPQKRIKTGTEARHKRLFYIPNFSGYLTPALRFNGRHCQVHKEIVSENGWPF